MKKPTIYLVFSVVLLVFSACEQEEVGQMPKFQEVAGAVSSTIPASSWQSGSISSIVPPDELEDLGGQLEGTNIWKSNNPEIFRGTGWLMQNSRTDASRGGSATPMSGTFPIYLFHINKTGSQKYVHVLVTNPNSSTITISGKGSMYNNAEKPLTGSGTGQSFHVAKDWINNNPRTSFSNVSLGQYQAYEVAKLPVSNNGMIDGRFEVTASQGVYVYTVVTSGGSFTDAVNKSQGGPAAGDIYSPGTNAYGREAGVYDESVWKGTTNLPLPASTSHLGLALNTSSKFAVNGVYLQNQNADDVMRLSDSADKTYGNYGHKYDITLAFTNPHSTSKTVSVYFGSNYTNSVNTPSFTYNGPVLMNGVTKNVYTTPTSPRQWLATWTVPAGGAFNGNFDFYVPGLITTGQQLVLVVN
ncbi:DUF3370 family protein [Marinoscillum furvescens]|uniref:Uncharacterized protein DUF3370 n=1 Tax=Marinoscillum furvescens DSM 4134 TaxID=1122208 RepID=A0A3D9L8H9_MARFU|nr:DUF3370 family protein [Marinoscillum furvescens]REE01177.1 uncharacterized protein DUF3370 [Marinoscillum furvescens DSM 4134]